MLMQGREAKSGEPRHATLTYSRDGEDYVVAGTAGGSTKLPAWVANMRAHPDLTLEIGQRSFAARASDRRGRGRASAPVGCAVECAPWFSAHPEQAQRAIPMIRLTPSD